LITPNTGSGVCLREAYSLRPSGVFSRWAMASTGVGFSGGGQDPKNDYQQNLAPRAKSGSTGLNIFPHELLAHLRQTGRLATRVFGHALGPRAALAALFSLRLIRHFHALRRVWLIFGCVWLLPRSGAPSQ
jgi:hypothetical protein